MQENLFSWSEDTDRFIDFGLIGGNAATVLAAPVVMQPEKEKKTPIVILPPGPRSIADIQAAWESLPEDAQRGKIRLTYSQPVRMTVNRRKYSEPKTVHVYRLFVGANSGRLAYTNTSRTGWSFDAQQVEMLVSLEAVPEKSGTDMIEKVRKLGSRFHPNAWGDLKAKLLADPASYYANYGYTVTSITRKFPDYVIDNIKRAFEEKGKYTYDAGGYRGKKSGRDFKVECKLCEDGIFRAWFSSEFPGCANGDYWLLINPTTAIFKERD